MKLALILTAVTLAACFLQPAPSSRPELRLEKLYVDYIHAQEAIHMNKPDRVDIQGKIAATKYCLSALRKEFDLPTPK